MRNIRWYIYSILTVVVTLLYIRCTDEPLLNAENPPVSAGLENKTVKAMKQCFEENATTLKQVHSNLAYHPHMRGSDGASQSCCCAANTNAAKRAIDIVPKWDAARLWEGQKKIYAEVLLQGKGMHFAAYIQSGNKKQVYLANNLLMFTQDKENGEIHYYVITTLADLSKYGTRQKQEKMYRFVGNKEFEGIVIYSKTDGTFTKALHLHDGKSHPIFFGRPSATTRSQNNDAANEGSIVTLTSALSCYDGQETGEGVQGESKCNCTVCVCYDCPGNKAYCVICGEYYNVKLGKCPNNCDFIVTPGGGEGGNTGGGGIGWIPVYTTCPYCYRQYDTSFSNCPYCDGRRCSSCGQYPCVCIEDSHRCELCGSQYCPGPWSCGGECIGEICPVCGGYKSTTRSNNNCPVCICDEHKITLWKTPAGIIDLGSPYTLTIMDTSRPQSKITQIEYNIFNAHGMVASSQPDIFTSNITYTARSPGYWKIQAIATFEDGQRATSNMLDLTIQNPLYSDIMNNPTVKAKMDELWNAAVQDALSEPPVYHEKGCIIYLNTANNSYEFEDVPDSQEFECEGVTEIIFNVSTPNGYWVEGKSYPVATFHTHPARTKCSSTIQYKVGPSEIDKKMNTVCLLYDYVGDFNKIITGGHSVKDSHKLYHCAKERNPLN